MLRIEVYAAMGMPETDGGLNQTMRLSLRLWGGGGVSPPSEAGWPSHEVAMEIRQAPRYQGAGLRLEGGRLGMYVVGGGCLIDRHPGPCGFKKRQGLLQCPGSSSGRNPVPRGTLRARVSRGGVPAEPFLTPPATRGGGEWKSSRRHKPYCWNISKE